MYERQVAQYLNFKPIACARGSMWGALNDVSNRLDDVSTPTKNDEDANEASPEIQQNSDAHSSGSQEGDKEHVEDDEEWLDVEDEDHEKNDGVVPMLGNYKVTRGPKDDQKHEATPMLGNCEVTHGPEPINHSSKESQKKPTVDTQKINRSTTPAHCESGAQKDEEESTGDWTDVEDKTDEEVQDENSPEENGDMPTLGTDEEVQDENPPEENRDMPTLGEHKVTRGDTPSDSDHETPEAEKESGHDSTQPLSCGTNMEEISRQDVTTPVRVPRAAGPSSPDSDTTNHLGDAAGSRASPQDVTTPVLDTTPKVRLPTPRLCGIDNQDPTPRVRLPQQPIRNQTQPAPVTPSTRTSTQEELDSSTSSPRAIFRQPPRTSETPSTPVNSGFPPRDESVASPSRTNNGGMKDGNRAPPTGPAAGVPRWSPRGNARGGRGGRGGYQTHQSPAQNVPVKGPVPRGPAAATNNTPSRRPGRGRGSGSAASSFQRFQERMAMETRS